jgi:DUF4097 and DUF4098 domain-containing protein YvlB
MVEKNTKEMEMNSMSSLVRVLLVALFMLASTSGAAQFEDVFDETYPLSGDGTVSLDNVNGDVTIEVWERSEVRVYAVKSASSQGYLDRLRIDVDASSSSIDIDTFYPSTSGREAEEWLEEGHRRGDHKMKVEYTLTVPRRAVIDGIDLVNGSLVVDGVEGGVAAESVNGTISVRNGAGSFGLATVNGAVELYADRLDLNDRIDLESVNGALDLYLPSSAGADVRAESVNGKLSNDFGIEVHRGKYVGSDFRGAVGGGGSRVALQTVNGRISVHRW